MEPFEDEGVSWFGDLQEQFSDQARMIRIHGVAGKRYLTLDGCFNTNTTFEMPGVARTELLC